MSAVLLSLTLDAAYDLQVACWAATTLGLDVNVDTLRRVVRDLDRQLNAEDLLCQHCGLTEAKTKNLCRPCDTYRRKYDHLPSQDTLQKRSARMQRNERNIRADDAMNHLVDRDPSTLVTEG